MVRNSIIRKLILVAPTGNMVCRLFLSKQGHDKWEETLQQNFPKVLFGALTSTG